MEKLEKEQPIQGQIFVVSAPSGAGKTTLCQIILEKFSKISYSISHTTRSPRAGEEDGVDYFFISKEEFEERIQKNLLVEWAKVHNNYYGTSVDFIQNCIQKGKSLLLDIDVQGARQIKNCFPDAVTIFISPPSFKVLEERLRKRGTDAEDVILQRLDNAENEMAQKDFYEYEVVNDDLESAAKELTKIMAEILG